MGKQGKGYQTSLPNVLGSPSMKRLLNWLDELPMDRLFQQRVGPSFSAWQLFMVNAKAEGILLPASGNLSSR